MIVSMITMLGFGLTAIPFIYFLNRYLKPKNNSLRTWGYGLVIIETYIIVASNFFFPQMALKMFTLLFCLYACVMLLYEGSLLRKITAPFLLIAIMLLTEIPFDFVMVRILNLDLITYTQNPLFLLFIRIVYNAMVLLNYYFLLKLTNRNSILKKEPQLYLLMCLQLFIEAICISMMQISEVYDISFQARLFTMCILGLGIAITGALMLHYLRRLYQRTKLELSMKKMEIEYTKVLAEYLNVNDDMRQYLRHDIMNYLLHNEIRKKGETDETAI